MYTELSCHDSERHAFLVPRCGQGDGLVGHFADHAPSSDAGLVEMVDHRGPVHLVPAGEFVDGSTLAVPMDQLFDLGSRQPPLHRV